MVSTKFILIASFYFVGLQIINAGDTIACTAVADCTSTNQKCIAADPTHNACVEVCTTDADCGGVPGSCTATTTGDIAGTTGFSTCPIIAQGCLTDTECSTLDATLPICNVYTLTCMADPTVVATTTTIAATTTTISTTTTQTTTKASVTTAACADKVTGGSNDCVSMASYCKNSVYLSLMKDKCPKTCGYCSTSSGSSGSGSTSTGCVDKVVNGSNDCASMASYCTNTIYKSLMKEQCPKTCGYCTSTSSNTSSSSSSGSSSTGTCKDASSDCSTKSYLCKNTIYKDLMKSNCASTCGYC